MTSRCREKEPNPDGNFDVQSSITWLLVPFSFLVAEVDWVTTLKGELCYPWKAALCCQNQVRGSFLSATCNQNCFVSDSHERVYIRNLTTDLFAKWLGKWKGSSWTEDLVSLLVWRKGHTASIHTWGWVQWIRGTGSVTYGVALIRQGCRGKVLLSYCQVLPFLVYGSIVTTLHM